MHKAQNIRQGRILELRGKITLGWNYDRLIAYVQERYGVTAQTAYDYVETAAAPFREAYRKKQKQTF